MSFSVSAELADTHARSFSIHINCILSFPTYAKPADMLVRGSFGDLADTLSDLMFTDSLSIYRSNWLARLVYFLKLGERCHQILVCWFLRQHYLFGFFSWTFICPYFFQYLDLHVSILFIAHASLFYSLTKTGERERDQHILWSFYFVEWVDGTMLTSQRSIVRGYMVCTWILIIKAWKEFSQGSQQFDKAQCKDKQHMCMWFSRSIIIWLW